MTRDSNLAIAVMVHDSIFAVQALVDYYVKNRIPVVVHVDMNSADLYLELSEIYKDTSDCTIISRHTCKWGTWSLVEAELTCYAEILRKYKSVEYISFTSGSDLPIRPIKELASFLLKCKDDFIECIDITRYNFVVSGPEIERFSYWWFFSYIHNRYLFGLFYKLQKYLRICRTIPLKMTPCMGGQFKTLKVETITAVRDLLRRHPRNH